MDKLFMNWAASHLQTAAVAAHVLTTLLAILDIPESRHMKKSVQLCNSKNKEL